MRVPEDLADAAKQQLESDEHIAVGQLWVADGVQKLLAAFVVWLACIAVMHHTAASPDIIADNRVMLSSFLRIKTMDKASDGDGASLNAMIGQVIKQNQDARVQPITSFAWSQLLGQLGPDRFGEALKAYNEHPQCDNTIALDRKKARAISHWMENTARAAYEVVVSSNNDQPFTLGPFSESFAQYSWAFLNSQQPTTALMSPEKPLAGEASFTPNWNLPLDELAQRLSLVNSLAEHLSFPCLCVSATFHFIVIYMQ